MKFRNLFPGKALRPEKSFDKMVACQSMRINRIPCTLKRGRNVQETKGSFRGSCCQTRQERWNRRRPGSCKGTDRSRADSYRNLWRKGSTAAERTIGRYTYLSAQAHIRLYTVYSTVCQKFSRPARSVRYRTMYVIAHCTLSYSVR